MTARTSGLRSVAAWAAIGLLGIVLTVEAQWQLRKLPPPVVDVNMLFVPPPALVEAGAAGYQNLLADGLWLSFLQYYGGRLGLDNNHFVNLGPMFALITDLDPHFWFAYWLGSWALGDNHEGKAALVLLHKGAAFNPDDYNYPYQEGYVEFLFLKDYGAAAAAFERSSRLPNAPRFAQTMAARMLQKQGLDDQALAIWQRLYEADTDSVTKGIAKRNVDRIKAEMAGAKKRAFPIGHKPGQVP